MRLPEYARDENSIKGSTLEITLRPEDVTPGIMEVLTRLDKVGVLNDQAVMALVGQAPIDPLGIAQMLRERVGGWTVQPLNATVMAVIAKNGATPVALCIVDLISSAVAFVACREGKLVEVDRFDPDTIEKKLQELRTESAVLDWLEGPLRAAIAVGKNTGEGAKT